jgi:hypothetical protein
MKWLLDKIEADFENKLIHSVVIRWIIIIGASLSLSIVGMIIYNSWGAELCKPIFSGDCLSNFSYNMQLPAKLITATLAISGFWALIFRSHQTTKQIETAQQQIKLTIENNYFNNYIDHKKIFMEMLADIEEQQKCEVINKTYLYDSMFPNNTPIYVSFSGNNNFIKQLEIDYVHTMNALLTHASNISNRDPRIDPDIGLIDTNIEDFKYIHTHMQTLARSLESLNIKGTSLQSFSYHDDTPEEGPHTVTAKAYTDLGRSLWAVRVLIRQLSRFSGGVYDQKIVVPIELIESIDVYDRYVTLMKPPK